MYRHQQWHQDGAKRWEADPRSTTPCLRSRDGLTQGNVPTREVERQNTEGAAAVPRQPWPVSACVADGHEAMSPLERWRDKTQSHHLRVEGQVQETQRSPSTSRRGGSSTWGEAYKPSIPTTTSGAGCSSRPEQNQMSTILFCRQQRHETMLDADADKKSGSGSTPMRHDLFCRQQPLAQVRPGNLVDNEEWEADYHNQKSQLNKQCGTGPPRVGRKAGCRRRREEGSQPGGGGRLTCPSLPQQPCRQQ
jgi:hypothetical protein